MPDGQPITDAASTEARIDWFVLDLLNDHDNQRPWAVAEVTSAYGHEQNALDALDRLQAAGLIHSTSDDFVFLTRAAIRYNQIAE